MRVLLDENVPRRLKREVDRLEQRRADGASGDGDSEGEQRLPGMQRHILDDRSHVLLDLAHSPLRAF